MGLEAKAKVGRPVGVAGLDPRPPEEEGLRTPALDVFNPGAKTDCLDARLFLVVGSSSEFASLDFNAVGRALGVPISFVLVLCDSISSDGKRGVPGGVISQS